MACTSHGGLLFLSSQRDFCRVEFRFPGLSPGLLPDAAPRLARCSIYMVFSDRRTSRFTVSAKAVSSKNGQTDGVASPGLDQSPSASLAASWNALRIAD